MRVIDALKKKEKEERNRKAEEEAESTLRQDGGNFANNNNFASSNSPQKNNENSANTPANGQWYFYSPLTVSQGKAQFQKLWGKRDNVQNWVPSPFLPTSAARFSPCCVLRCWLGISANWHLSA